MKSVNNFLIGLRNYKIDITFIPKESEIDGTSVYPNKLASAYGLHYLDRVKKLKRL